MVSNYLGDIDKQIREDRKETIRSMYLQCYTAQEISEVVGLSSDSIEQEIRLCRESEEASKIRQTANFQDDFDPPIYNRFSYGKVTNATDHFGKTEQRILDNLLYLYTNPFDIVVDPFGGFFIAWLTGFPYTSLT